MRLALASAAARTAQRLSRASGRGGTSLPGKVLLRAAPGAIGQLAARLSRGSAVVSATNGKTTTSAMVAGILRRGGARLVHNVTGANMAGGVATALLDGEGDTGLFEVDELWLDRIVPEVRPRAILLANLFRDQLDRSGELETIADRWAVVAGATGARLVLNADDPIVADLGRERGALYFGVEDASLAMEAMAHAADAKHCRRCGHPYTYDAVLLGHLGHWHCPNCGQRRPVPEVVARDVVLDGVRGARFVLEAPEGTREVALPLPGLYNVYNALGAAALATALGAPLDDVAAGLAEVSPAFGRAETVVVDGVDVLVLLVKNPAGANEVLRTLALEPGEHDLLCVLNDGIADGRDVSWVWDADFEALAGSVRRVVCSGTRASEMAVRLKYAGVPAGRLVVVDELAAALDDAVRGVPEGGRLFALPTYTAMLSLRGLLAGRGLVRTSLT